MILNYDGQRYEWDIDDMTVDQALAIEKFMGCSYDEWGKRLQQGTGDMRAVKALGWLILHPGGDVPIEDANFKVNKLRKALEDAVAAELAAAAEAVANEPVPTGAASTGLTPAAASSPQS